MPRSPVKTLPQVLIITHLLTNPLQPPDRGKLLIPFKRFFENLFPATVQYFEQLLIYWKFQVSSKNLQVCNIQFSIYLFKLSSITLSRVITATMFFLECYSCTVILLELFLKSSNHILNSSHSHNELKAN